MTEEGTTGRGTGGLEPGDAVTVLGAGNMGSGIAQAVAAAGFSVRLRDLTDADLERGRTAISTTLEGAIRRGKSTPEERDRLLSRIRFTTDLDGALEGARLVIEAVFEEESVKRPLFEEVVRRVSPQCLVVTNTSSLSVSRLFAGLPEPGRFAGLHFFYPAAINRLVEVVGGEGTSPQTLGTLTRFSYGLRKIPILVKDSAGFCVNRFFVPFLNEATRLLGEGVADIPTIEAVANDLLGTSMGPFQLMNVTGIPIAYHSMESLEKAFGAFYAPSPTLAAQFQKKEKWAWEGAPGGAAQREPVRERFLGVVLGIATRLVEEGVATPEETDRGAVVGLRWKRGPFAILNETGLSKGHAAVEAIHKSWGESFPVSQELTSRTSRGEARWPLAQVRWKSDPPLGWILLDRPESLNALNRELLTELEGLVERAASDPEIRVVLIAGSSNVFAAGADITEMAAQGVAEAREFTLLGQRVTRRIETLSKPTIAVVEGYALGGGLELALSADFILAARGTVFGFPEVGLGIHPGFGGTQRMLRLAGRARTKLFVTSGLRFTAEEAYDMGLVARLHPPESLHREAKSLALQIAAQAPLAVQMARSVIDRGEDADLASALQLEAQSAVLTFASQDQKEGMQAFLERRPPRFQGK